MQIVVLKDPVHLRGERTLVLGHSLTELTRGLEPRESVVLETVEGDFYAAQVRGIEFELDDTVYTFEVGARLPEDLARERVDGLDATVHDLSLHELVDLLGGLRGRTS